MIRRAFTLIELLIVVGIIAILAAIALVNFLEAQTRAKVSRVHTDMRALATAVEAYAVDASRYPEILGLLKVTTPVPYMSTLPGDVFAARNGSYLGYVNALQLRDPSELEQWEVTVSTPGQRAELANHIWFIWSNGPDKIDDSLDNTQQAFYEVVNGPGANKGLFYDPTNGTVSSGDVIRSSRFTK
jgi:prepilin-type N-terminal cleavage/methylation domain-containing protein